MILTLVLSIKSVTTLRPPQGLSVVGHFHLALCTQITFTNLKQEAGHTLILGTPQHS